MFIKLIIYFFLIYFALKVIRFVRAVSASNVAKRREQTPPPKSYNERDIIDVDFKEIKSNENTAGKDQQYKT